MRWQHLFADLTAQFDAAERAADQAELASRTRSEVGAVRLVDRLRAAVGTEVTVGCRGVGPLRGVLTDVGADWLLLAQERGQEALVAWRAVQEVRSLGRDSAPADGAGFVRARLELRWALRAVARERNTVQVLLDDGSALSGTIDRVGADFFDLAEHAVDELRRAGVVRGVRAVRIDAVVLVRTVPAGLG